MEYLTSLFEETYIKDIIERNHIEKVQEINDLINILASGIGSLTNASKIKATFKSVIQSDISLNTIRAYIDHLKDSQHKTRNSTPQLGPFGRMARCYMK